MVDKALSDDELIDWLQLARTGGIGPLGFARMLDHFGSARAALAALPQLIARGRKLKPCPRSRIEDELAALARFDVTLITLRDPGYPPALAVLPDPPPVITVAGDLNLLHAPTIGMVGARNASGHGRKLAHEIANALAQAEYTIVSGLARGIDTAAHKGALDQPGGTIAVIASGIDIAYPPENTDLMAAIAKHGAVITEYPLGLPPRAKHFPQRNRLIAGLSLGTLVVEATPKSGSLITARLAADYGREVMAMPGSPADARHRGSNALLKDGAALIENAADVLAVIEPLRNLRPKAVRQRSRELPPVKPKPAPRAGDKTASQAPGSLELRLRECLGTEPLHVDELIRQCHATAAEVQRTLLDFELAGLIERHPGNRIALARS